MIRPQRAGVYPLATDVHEVLFKCSSGQDVLHEVRAIQTYFPEVKYGG